MGTWLGRNRSGWGVHLRWLLLLDELMDGIELYFINVCMRVWHVFL